MKTTDVYASESRYLRADDLRGREVEVTIAGAETVDLSDGKTKIALSFTGKEKLLVLNVTNARAIEDVLGDETDQWVGHRIVLFPTRVDFQGQRVPAIRVRVPQPGLADVKAAASKAKASAVVPVQRPAPEPHLSSADFDDDIPF